MAHFQKYTAAASRGIIAHCRRTSKTEKSYIDSERTHLNIQHEGYGGNIDRAIKHIGARCLNRADVKKCISLCVTLPSDVHPDDMGKFFNSALGFMIRDTENKIQKAIEKDDRTIKQNSIIGAYIHRDETTPHMHVLFVPVVRDQKKGDLKVSAKEFLTKDYLQHFHDRLSRHIEHDLGYRVSVVHEEPERRLKAKDNVNIHAYRIQKQAELDAIEKQIENKKSHLMKLDREIEKRTARNFYDFERDILDGTGRYDRFAR